MEIGGEVSERQDLIKLPTADSMKAEVFIHETSLEKARVGLPAVITVEAMAGKKFLGRVERIAPLPDARMQWANPDLKAYLTDIYLEGSDSELRTGMSCKAEIIIAQYEDVVYIPVQAVLRIAGQPTVYVVDKDGSYTERKVEIGLDDNKMVRVVSGLEEGEVVLMTPPLRDATIESASKMSGHDSPDGSDTIKGKINQRLEEANGKADKSRPSQQSQEQSKDSDKLEIPSSDQIDQMRKRLEKMSPEEQQKEMEKIKTQFENMSQEEKDKLRQRFQGGGGSRQERGQRQETGGQRQGAGGQRPQGAERDQ
jgi:hypothetical protein